MQKKKQAIMAVSACALAGVMGLSGMLAYLTDNETHTNTFSVDGKSTIDLTEPSWPQEDSDQNGIPDEAERIVPNQEISKDPMVTNTGEQNDVVVFLRVTVPVKDVTLVADDGTIQTLTYTQAGDTAKTPWTPSYDANGNVTNPAHMSQELFYMKQSGDAINVHANSFGQNWVELPSKESLTLQKTTATSGTFENGNWSINGAAAGAHETGAGQRTYVFGYNTSIAPGASTTKLFNKVQLKNIIENELAEGQIQNIKVEAFSIQADNLVNSTGQAVDTSSMTESVLNEVYDMYIHQNGHIVTEADKAAGKYADKAVGDMVYDFYQDAEHGMVEKEADTNNLRNLKGDAAVGTAITSKVANTKLKVGDTTELTTTYRPQGKAFANNVNDCSIVSSNPEVVAVSNASANGNATLTAKGIGDASITVTTRDGATTAIHITVQNDARPTDGQDDGNDASNIPSGSSQP